MTKLPKIPAADIEVLKSRGYVPGNPSTIPENINPALREQLIQDWAKDNDVTDTMDMPSAVDRGNALARARSEGEEEGKPQPKRQGETANKE